MPVTTMAFEDVQRIERTLFFEPPDMRNRLTRFVMLILFASIIATGGLLSDSVASIIGAMIVAPLMTPIMGMVVALVIGSSARFTRSLILVLAGIVLAIGMGWLMATLMPFGWDPATSEQVMSRTSPRLLDLVIALASGGAGAYALSRTDVADALPGVAIAISLVPPLNTVGILLAGDSISLATGAMVLFLTNFGAILLAGTVTFLLTGLGAAVGRGVAQVRRAFLAIIAFVVLIAIPLQANSNLIWQDATRESDTFRLVEDWLAPTDWEIYEVRVSDDEVTLLLGGEGDPPTADRLVRDIHSLFNGEVVVTTRIVDVRTITLTGTPVAGNDD